MTRRLVLVGGGVRSGKSAFALARARRLPGPRVFLATAEPLDDEMAARIARHRTERDRGGGDGDAFVTVEAPRDLAEALARLGEAETVLVDCLTLWLSNLLVGGLTPAGVLERVDELAVVLARRRVHAIVVSNEVGLGIVPETPLGRAFRDVAGIAHQRLAAISDEVYFAALGTVLRLRPGPVAAVGPADEARS